MQNRSRNPILYVSLALLSVAGIAHAQTATIGGSIYTGANDGTAPIMAPAAAALAGAQVMVQNQHSGGAFVTYGTVTGNSWTATVPAPGDYVVMFSAVGHDATSREFMVVDGDVLTKDAYLPPLFTNLDGTASFNELPLANILVYTFLDNAVNGEDDAPDDPPLNGVTVYASNEDGYVLAMGVTGTQPAPIITADGTVITDVRGHYYFTGLPPGEVFITSDPTTAHLYDVNGPLSLGGVTNFGTRRPIDFDPTTEFYHMSSEEGGRAFEAVLYPGDPGTEDGGYLVWQGFVEKMGQITAANVADPDRFPYGPGLAQAGTISAHLVDADMPFDPIEPLEALVPILHPGVSANGVVPDGFVVLFTDGEVGYAHPVATAEADPVTGYVEFQNVPPGKYKLFLSDIPIDYVYIERKAALGPNQVVAFGGFEQLGTLMPRFFGRVQGFVYDNSTVPPTPLAGETVHIRFKDGSIQYTTTTDASGWYNFDNMPEIEVMAYVDVEPPAGYRGAMITDTFHPDAVRNNPFCDPALPGCMDPGLPLDVTHNAINRYVQWYTAKYRADLYVEPIPAGVGQINGFVFYDSLEKGTWVGDGLYAPDDERTVHGVTVELWNATSTAPILDATTGLPVTTATGAFDESAVLAQGRIAPYSVPPDEWGGVFVGPMVGYYEFRDLPPGDYTVKLSLPDPLNPDPLHALNGFAATTPAEVIVTTPSLAASSLHFGVNTTPADAPIGVPLAGGIEGGVFDDLIVDANLTSTLAWEKRGVPGAPVGVYDHLGYFLGAGSMGFPNCNPVNNAIHIPGDVSDPNSCPAGQPLAQGPEMERRFAPGAHLYLGNDPTLPGYNPDYLPIMLPYTFGPGQYKFEADWSLLPIAFAEGPTNWPAAGFDPPPPLPPAPVINNVAPVGSYLITGSNFGVTRGFSTVTLAGVELAVTSWSDTEIHVDDPLTPVSGHMIVTTWSGPSNGVYVDAGSVPASSLFVEAGAIAGDGTQTNPFGTITEALNNLPVETPRYVFVAAGTYDEHIQFIESDIRLIGAGPNDTILDGRPRSITVASQGYSGGGGPVIFIGQGGETGSVENIMISGFTITGGSVKGDLGAGIQGDAGNRNLDINNCTITENGGYYGGAIWLQETNHDVRIWSNTISNNGCAGGYSGGISVNDEPEYGPHHGEPEHVVDDDIPGCPPGVYEIFNNHITRNFSPDYGGGICLYEVKDHLVVAGNLIEDNKADDHGGGMFFEDSGPIEIYGNTIRRNYSRDDGGGISFEDVGDDNAQINIHNNLIIENISDDCGENSGRGGAIAFDDTFYAAIYDNTIVGNIVAGSHDPTGGSIDSERNGHEYNGSEPLGQNYAPGFSDPLIYNNIIWDNMRLHYDQPGVGEEEDLAFTFGLNYEWSSDELHVDNPAVQPEWENALNSESFSYVVGNVISGGAYGNLDADPQFVDQAGNDFHLAAGSPAADLGAYANGGGLPYPLGTISPLAVPAPMCNEIDACLMVEKAKIGTKERRCNGIELLETTSMNGEEQLVVLYLPDEDEDELDDHTTLDDDVNAPVTIDTDCSLRIEVGDVFGAYTVTDVVKSYDDRHEYRGNKVEIRGTFDALFPIDMAAVDTNLTIDDGFGHEIVCSIPSGSFVLDGDHEEKEFEFEGWARGAYVEAEFEDCEFKIELRNVANTTQLVGTTMTVDLRVGLAYGLETIVLEDRNNHLKYDRETELDSCGGVVQPIEFSHAEHMEEHEANLTCQNCHIDPVTQVFTGVPGKATCLTCHGDPNSEHYEEVDELDPYINSDEDIPWVTVSGLRDDVSFSHDFHGIATEADCLGCHRGQSFRDQPRWTSYTIMRMGECRNCHEETGARNDCGACHLPGDAW